MYIYIYRHAPNVAIDQSTGIVSFPVCMCVSVCVYVCVYACMRVRVYYVCICISCVYIHTHMYIVCIYVHTHTHTRLLSSAIFCFCKDKKKASSSCTCVSNSFAEFPGVFLLFFSRSRRMGSSNYPWWSSAICAWVTLRRPRPGTNSRAYSLK